MNNITTSIIYIGIYFICGVLFTIYVGNLIFINIGEFACIMFSLLSFIAFVSTAMIIMALELHNL